MASYVEAPQAIAKLDWSMSFQRTGKFPIDRSSMFESYADAVKYAAGDATKPDKRGLCGTSYVGQVITVFENDVVTVYKIEPDRTLAEVGRATAGDGKSISLSEDGVLSIKGFENATAGQQPRIVNKGTAEKPDLQIEWYTPDTSTVTGLAETVGALTETVNGVTDKESGEVTKEGLVHKVNALEANKANKTDVYTKGEIDGKLTGALHYKGTKATFQTLLDEIAAEGSTYVPAVGDVWNITSVGTGENDTNVDASGVSIEAGDNVIYNGTGWDVSSSAVDLSGYYNKTEITDLLDGNEEKGIAGKVDKVEGSSLMTTEQAERLAEVTKTEASEINGNIKIDDQETTVYTLPTASGGVKGGIKTSTANNGISVDADGVASVNKVDASKIDGIVAEASKVTNSITIGAKTFDGSAAIEIKAEDLPIPEDIVRDTDIATGDALGLVKSSEAQDKVLVEADGTMTVNDISASKVTGVVSEAAKVTNKLTAGQKTFDGSAAVEIKAEDLGAAKTTDLDNYVKKTDIATAAAAGIVKSSTAKDNIAVDADGVMSINTISGSKVDGAVATATNAEKLGGVASADILDGTSGKVKSAAAADKLATAKNINITGDATGTASFDGSAEANINVTLKEVGTAGTYTKVTTDANGRVTAGADLAATDIPDLTLAKITDAGALAGKDEVAKTDLADALVTELNELGTNSHTHDNKTVLDGISSAKVTSWDDAASKIDSKANAATTIAGYGITDAYTKAEVDGKVSGAYHFMGSYETFAALEAAVTNKEITPLAGHVYNIITAGGTDKNGNVIHAGDNVAYVVETGEGKTSGWDVLGGTMDLSAYATTAKVNDELNKKADKTTVEGISGKVDALESTVGDDNNGLVKTVADHTTRLDADEKDIAALKTTVGDKDSGLVQKAAANTAAIETLNGEATKEGSVKNLIAASASDINATIEGITKDGGTIDTKVSTAINTHNTAEDAHSDLFAAKQNKAIQASITFEVADFVESDNGYKASKAVTGLDVAKDYAPAVSPTLASCATVAAAQFYPTAEVNAGQLTLYCVNAPTAAIVVNGTFTEIQ